MRIAHELMLESLSAPPMVDLSGLNPRVGKGIEQNRVVLVSTRFSQ